MLVKETGSDVMGKVSDVIAPHGCCSGYEPNYSKINDTRRADKKKRLTTEDVT